MDYSQKEQKHPITKAVLAPMKAVKKMVFFRAIVFSNSLINKKHGREDPFRAYSKSLEDKNFVNLFIFSS